MSNFILWLSEIHDENLVGNKVFFLSKMYQSKFSVPPAFCVTKEAFSYFLESTGLKRKIDEALLGKENLNDISYAIQELIVETDIPFDLKKEIEEAYENINVDPAVQNTGTAFSFIKAGRDSSCVVVRAHGNFESNVKNTLLNVKGSKNLIYSLKKVWALHYTPENIANGNLNNLALATLVQKMVSPIVSGSFYFEDSDLVIKAVYGFLDSEINDKADFYTLDRNSLYVKNRNLHIQDSKLVKDDMIGSIVMRQIANPGTKLSDNDLSFIAQVAKKLEMDYPDKEITFAIEGTRLYFLNVKNKKESVQLPVKDVVIPDFLFNSESLAIPEESKEEVKPLSPVELALIEAKSGEVHIRMPKDRKSLHIAQRLLDTLSLQIED